MTVVLKVLCAWCGETITEGEPDEHGLISHGICPQCFDEHQPHKAQKDPWDAVRAREFRIK